jgi:hypothetical protein
MGLLRGHRGGSERFTPRNPLETPSKPPRYPLDAPSMPRTNDSDIIKLDGRLDKAVTSM